MYRILTEEKDVDRLKATLVGMGLDFTLFSGLGSWRGLQEKSIAFEFDNISRQRAEEIATIIKVMNTQKAVLLQEFPVISELI
jgi:hypothetical protein